MRFKDKINGKAVVDFGLSVVFGYILGKMAFRISKMCTQKAGEIVEKTKELQSKTIEDVFVEE